MELLGKVNKALNTDGNVVLRKVLQTVEEMLNDRGCTNVRVSPNVAKSINQSKRVVWGLPSEDGRVPATDVYISTEDKVGVRFARHIVEQSGNDVKVICVSTGGPTPFTRKECDERSIQFISALRLCTNVTKHALVPKHTVVTDCKYATDLLPKMLETDPVAQYYAWPIGTVIKVNRTVGCGEPIAYFRVVVSASS